MSASSDIRILHGIKFAETIAFDNDKKVFERWQPQMVQTLSDLTYDSTINFENPEDNYNN